MLRTDSTPPARIVPTASRPLRRHRITRRLRDDNHFDYFLNGTRIRKRREIERLNALIIPPAWQDVRIAESGSAKVLAVGIDAAGRTQTLYHPRFRNRQDQKKFERMARFGKALPKLRSSVDRDLRRRRLRQDLVVACVFRIIDQQLLRIGSPEYARQHHSYGATTLLRKHVRVTSDCVALDFVGKSGKRQRGRIRDPRVARIITKLREIPGEEIFQYIGDDGNVHGVRSHHVNAYIKKHMGAEFTAKDFRTWGGTVAVGRLLLTTPTEELTDERSRRRIIREAIESAAERLGNTPAVTRSSYVDPRILRAADDPELLLRVRRWNPPQRDFLSPDEQRILRLLGSLRGSRQGPRRGKR